MGLNPSIMDWAKNEIDIVSKRTGDGYYMQCAESALKAFESIMGDGHSGLSITVTKGILNRFINGKPLTEIRDKPSEWTLIDDADGDKHYQCNRMSSLFKRVSKEGNVSYSDVSRVVCEDIDTGNRFSYGLVKDIFNDMCPIEMPYKPASEPTVVMCEDFLVDPANGDFDTVGIFFATDPQGNKLEINRFFTERDGELVEITGEEYRELQNKKL